VNVQRESQKLNSEERAWEKRLLRTIVAARCGERRTNGFACCFVWAWDRDRACAGGDGVPVVFVSRFGWSALAGVALFGPPAVRIFAWSGLGFNLVQTTLTFPPSSDSWVSELLLVSVCALPSNFVPR
jgi:hypothetical protein